MPRQIFEVRLSGRTVRERGEDVAVDLRKQWERLINIAGRMALLMRSR